MTSEMYLIIDEDHCGECDCLSTVLAFRQPDAKAIIKQKDKRAHRKYRVYFFRNGMISRLTKWEIKRYLQ
jgi:hypothetical protein